MECDTSCGDDDDAYSCKKLGMLHIANFLRLRVLANTYRMGTTVLARVAMPQKAQLGTLSCTTARLGLFENDVWYVAHRKIP